MAVVVTFIVTVAIPERLMLIVLPIVLVVAIIFVMEPTRALTVLKTVNAAGPVTVHQAAVSVARLVPEMFKIVRRINLILLVLIAVVVLPRLHQTQPVAAGKIARAAVVLAAIHVCSILVMVRPIILTGDLLIAAAVAVYALAVPLLVVLHLRIVMPMAVLARMVEHG